MSEEEDYGGPALRIVRPMEDRIRRKDQARSELELRRQETYAFHLWALQEKAGAAYEEAVFMASSFRIACRDNREEWFGLNDIQVCNWEDRLLDEYPFDLYADAVDLPRDLAGYSFTSEDPLFRGTCHGS